MLQFALLRAAGQLPEGAICRIASCSRAMSPCTNSNHAHIPETAAASAQLTSLRLFASSGGDGQCLRGSRSARATTAAGSNAATDRCGLHCRAVPSPAQYRGCRGFAAASDAAPGSSSVSAVEADARICWRCGATVPRVSFFFCTECNVIQPAVPTADYFLLLDLPPGFDVDQKRLEAGYKWLQRRVHPDKFSTASPEEKTFSEEQSSLVSGVYTTLRDPLKRAIYLLERGGKLEAGSDGEGMAAADPAMLMRVMEIREQIEAARDDSELVQLREDNSREEVQQLQALSVAFGAGDLDAALELTAQLKYTDRIKAAIAQRTEG